MPMERFDYTELSQQMQRLAQTVSGCPDELPGEITAFLSAHRKLPPECADVIFWILTYDIAPEGAVRCFDWYTLHDVYQKLAVEHENMPAIILAYLRRHPSVESEELADFLWFAVLYRLALQNAWQLSCVDRLELFRAFIENMTIYAIHAIQPEAWNDGDIYLFTPELRAAYHVNRAYECLEQEDLAGYTNYLDMAVEDCPDLRSCLDTLKELPAGKEPPLSGMTQAEIQTHALRRVAEIKQAFQGEDWLKTAELVKQFDRDGFEVGEDFELLSIRCQLAERGLLW